MHVYLVRHGQTNHNVAATHQGRDATLTELGRQQARYVANSLKLFPIELILSSPFDRAKESAEIINKSLKKEVVFTEELREIMFPSALHGMHYDHPTSLEVRALMKKNANDPDWHHSDEENFYDACKRAQKLIKSFEAYGKEHILAVTHGGFLWTLMGIMLYGDKLTPELYWPIQEFLTITNTGISIIEKSEPEGWQREAKWRLNTWNDYAHLREIE
jgi:broad specificity phosphatase PhoE